jgi:hypothetical protein
MFSTLLAVVLVDNVSHFFEDWFDEISLCGGLEAEDSAFIATAWAGKLFGISDAMEIIALLNARGRRAGAATTVIFSLDNVQIALFAFEFLGCMGMNGFACAGEKGGIYLSRCLAKGSAIAPTELFLKFGNSCEQFANQSVAIGKIIRQLFWFMGISRFFSHGFALVFELHYIISLHRMRYQALIRDQGTLVD